MLIAASVLDAPLNCSFHFLLARLLLNRVTGHMCPMMLEVSCIDNMKTLLYILCMVFVSLIGVFAFKYYVFYSDIDAARKRLSGNSYLSDPSRKFAYESWFRGLDSASIYSKELIICGASKTIFNKPNSNDLSSLFSIYIVGNRTIIEVKVDGKSIFPKIQESTDGVFYERPDGLIIQHISLEIQCSEVILTDSVGITYKINDFIPIIYPRS
jgi:hypothetical protein